MQIGDLEPRQTKGVVPQNHQTAHVAFTKEHVSALVQEHGLRCICEFMGLALFPGMRGKQSEQHVPSLGSGTSVADVVRE